MKIFEKIENAILESARCAELLAAKLGGRGTTLLLLSENSPELNDALCAAEYLRKAWFFGVRDDRVASAISDYREMLIAVINALPAASQKSAAFGEAKDLVDCVTNRMTERLSSGGDLDGITLSNDTELIAKLRGAFNALSGRKKPKKEKHKPGPKLTLTQQTQVTNTKMYYAKNQDWDLSASKALTSESIDRESGKKTDGYLAKNKGDLHEAMRRLSRTAQRQ